MSRGLYLGPSLSGVVVVAVPRSWELELQAEAALASESLPPPPVFVEGTFGPNETLSTTLVGHDVSHAASYAIGQAVGSVFNVRRFRPGRSYRLLMEPTGELLAFEYSVDDENVLRVAGGDDGFVARVDALPLETRTDTISTTVVSSLWGALEGYPQGDRLVMELASVFEAQVDFYQDIRSGDAISLIVDAKYHDGQFVKYGPVVAAEFVNRGKPMQAYRFREEYYDENGMSARRSLLPSPLQFTRISSGFSYNRLHPIYNTVRPHLGVDYAAPTGTPVWAVSTGTVTFAGTNGGFGRMVTLRHPNGMTTSYAHFVFDCGRRWGACNTERDDRARRNDWHGDRPSPRLPDDCQRPRHRSEDRTCGSAKTDCRRAEGTIFALYCGPTVPSSEFETGR